MIENNTTSTAAGDYYMTIKQLAAHLGICEKTLLKLRKNGEIPWFWLGGKIMFSKTAVDKAIQNRMTMGAI